MKMSLAITIICSCTIGLCQNTNDDRPVLHETAARLVAVIDATDRANIVAARINVSRDVAERKLRLYALTAEAKTGVRTIEAFDVDVIYNHELVADAGKTAVTYHEAYNRQVFCFAIAQFAAGKKALGLQLVKLIAEVDPEYWWSSPSHRPFAIKDIIAGLEKEDDSVKELLKFETEGWANTVKNYGR